MVMLSRLIASATSTDADASTFSEVARVFGIDWIPAARRADELSEDKILSLARSCSGRRWRLLRRRAGRFWGRRRHPRCVGVLVAARTPKYNKARLL